MDRTVDARKFIRLDTLQLTVADNASQSSVVEFARECAFFKIANVTDTGIPAAVIIEFMAGDTPRPVFVNNEQITVEYPDEAFVWVVLPIAGVRFVSLRFSAVVTEAQVWQITGYEEAGEA